MKRPQFSIRDLLLLTAIVALAVGWWLDHRRLTQVAPTYTMYYVKWADSATAAKVIQAMFPSKAQVVADPKTKALGIVAQEDDIPAITVLLQKLEDQAKAAAEAERLRVSH